MVFHWSLSDSKSPQVTRALLSILAVLNNVVVWMISTRPPTSKSSSHFSNPLDTVPNAPITINIIVTCKFHSLLLLFIHLEFFTSVLADGFSLEFDWQPPQVSRTRLRILAVLRSAVVWIVSIRPPTSKSSRPVNNPLVFVPNAIITIGTIVTFLFHSFFNSLAMLRYLSFFSVSFRLILLFAGTAKSIILQILFFFCWLLWGLVFWMGLGDPFVC